MDRAFEYWCSFCGQKGMVYNAVEDNFAVVDNILASICLKCAQVAISKINKERILSQ